MGFFYNVPHNPFLIINAPIVSRGAIRMSATFLVMALRLVDLIHWPNSRRGSSADIGQNGFGLREKARNSGLNTASDISTGRKKSKDHGKSETARGKRRSKHEMTTRSITTPTNPQLLHEYPTRLHSIFVRAPQSLRSTLNPPEL